MLGFVKAHRNVTWAIQNVDRHQKLSLNVQACINLREINMLRHHRAQITKRVSRRVLSVLLV